MGTRASQNNEMRTNAILVLFALWMGAVGISLWSFFLRDAPQYGLDNLTMGLGWQGIAGLLALALAIWGIGYGLPQGHGVRRLSLVPLGIALGVAAMFVLGNLV